MFVGHLAVALGAKKVEPRVPLWGLVALTGLLWASQPWAPPAPSSMAVATTGLFMWMLPPWAAWIEKHRSWLGTHNGV